MKRTRYCWLLLTAGWLLAGAGLAQEPGPPPTSLGYGAVFELWNECKPIYLFVGLDGDVAALDLTRERIRTLAESRLRVARFYSTRLGVGLPYVQVSIGVLVSENRRGGAFVVEVSLHKHVHDVVSDHYEYAVTWSTWNYGIHTGDADYILQAAPERLDRFILEYLRVNETACR